MGHLQKSAAMLVISAAGNKQKFPLFLQKSVHRMSGVGAMET